MDLQTESVFGTLKTYHVDIKEKVPSFISIFAIGKSTQSLVETNSVISMYYRIFIPIYMYIISLEGKLFTFLLIRAICHYRANLWSVVIFLPQKFAAQ